jgi:hypothetical protein
VESNSFHSPRDLGLKAADSGQWVEALLLLNQAARTGHLDIAVLDALGEAAYKTGVPEALGPFQNNFKAPEIATHMARAFLMLGDSSSCLEFLNLARPSPLKSALLAMLALSADIKSTAAAFVPVAHQHPNLSYSEYWRALAAIADAIQNKDLTALAELRSKAMSYDDPNIHFNQALRFLGKGELRAGWRLYEWRLAPGAHQSNRTELGQMSTWEGESLNGKSLLIYLEQGLGDGLFALRYVKYFLDQGIEIQIVARPPLIEIIKSSFPNLKVHNEDQVKVSDYWDKNKGCDFWVYAFSIPYRTGTWSPYNTDIFLKVSDSALAKAKNIVASTNEKNLPAYAINWHGRIDTESDRSRAFTVEEFWEASNLKSNPSLIVSVQKDPSDHEIKTLKSLVEKSGGLLINADPYLDDFSATAAFIKSCNRLFTCDTSVAHLGGGLGHPTTVLSRNRSIWQWLRWQSYSKTSGIEIPKGSCPEDSIWYKNVKVEYSMAPDISWLIASRDIGMKNQNPNPTMNVTPVSNPIVTDQIKEQLEEQMQKHIAAGNLGAAEVIKDFLKKETEKGNGNKT